MKIIRFFPFFMFAVLLWVTACKKDEVTPTMTATVGGSSWTAITRVTRHTDNKFIITGTSTAGTVIAITVRGDAQKTYYFGASMDSVNAECVAVYQPDITSPSEDNFFSKSGSVALSKVDTEEKRISGAFAFEVTKLDSTISITGGKFSDLSYTESN